LQFATGLVYNSQKSGGVEMPILHVRNVPTALYNRLKEMAEEQNRSLSAQIITLLEQAVEDVEVRSQAEVIASIRQRRTFQPAAVGAPDSTELLRQDRQR
jgi:hypothetical protein